MTAWHYRIATPHELPTRQLSADSANATKLTLQLKSE